MVITYLLLLLFSMNFMLCGKYFLSAIFVGQCIKNKRIRIDAKFCVISAFALVYAIVVFATANKVSIDVLFLPVAYVFGLNMKAISDDKYKLPSAVFICLALGMCSHVFLNCVAEIIKNGGFNYGAVHYDFWSGQVSSSTGQMINFTFAAALLTYSVMKRGKNLFMLLLIVPCLIYGAIVGSRTAIMVSVISLAVGIIVLAVNAKSRRARVALIFVLLLVFMVYIVIKYDIFGISSILNKSYLFTRFDNSLSDKNGFFSTERWEIKAGYIRNAFQYPWGGGKIRHLMGGDYAHDLILDTLNEGGIFSSVLLVAYLIMWIKSIVKFIRRSNSLDIKVLFIPFLTVSLIQMTLEPILDGAPVFMMCLVLLDGVITNVNRMRNENEDSISV